jgi:hypothetical protein
MLVKQKLKVAAASTFIPNKRLKEKQEFITHQKRINKAKFWKQKKMKSRVQTVHPGQSGCVYPLC